METLDLYFGKKAPQLPAGFKEFLVKVAPWLVVISLVFSIPYLLTLIGFSAMALPGMYAAGYGGFGLQAIFSIVLFVLHALALPGLFKRSPSGWNFIFYATLVSLLQSLIMFNVVGFVLGFVIGFYFLFQLRPYYFGEVGPMPMSPAPQI